MTDQVTSLTAELAEERRRRTVAEAIAQERERTIEALTETISDYRRMLPPGRSTTGEGENRRVPEEPEPSTTPPVVEPPSILRRVFRRWL